MMLNKYDTPTTHHLCDHKILSEGPMAANLTPTHHMQM